MVRQVQARQTALTVWQGSMWMSLAVMRPQTALTVRQGSMWMSLGVTRHQTALTVVPVATVPRAVQPRTAQMPAVPVDIRLLTRPRVLLQLTVLHVQVADM